MGVRDRYGSPAAFRAALEQRLRREARESVVALYRLRKEAVFHRLLLRLRQVAPDGWAVKGGFALILRLGAQVRATKDVDANWRADRDALEATLSAVEEIDGGDWFTFAIGDARRLIGEAEAGAVRYPVTATLDGRPFEQLSLDINVVGPHDRRPVELVTGGRNLFAFVDEPALQVPMVTPAQQLAEKLHAYTRRYADEPSSRARDLFDMLVIAAQVQLPDGYALTAAVRDTFAVRDTAWPPTLPQPPRDWTQPWAGFIAAYPLPWTDLAAASTALRTFWQPVIDGTADTADVRWQPDTWHWTT